MENTNYKKISISAINNDPFSELLEHLTEQSTSALVFAVTLSSEHL